MEEFKLLSSLEIKHEYWNVTTPELFSIRFTSETQAFIDKFHIQYRLAGNKLHLLGNSRIFDYLNKNQQRGSFRILLIFKDSAMKNYTDVPQFRDQEVLSLNNDSGVEDITATMQVIPVRRSMAEFFINHPEQNILHDDGTNILTDLAIRPEHPEFSRALNALEEGVYKTSEDADTRFYYQSNLVKSLFATIALNFNHLHKGQHFQVNLKSRSLTITYKVKSKHYDLNKLKVLDADTNISFDSTVTDDEVIFTSDRAVKLAEKPPFNFQLLNGTRKPIREHMSLGTTKNFKRLNQDGNDFLNEILINI